MAIPTLFLRSTTDVLFSKEFALQVRTGDLALVRGVKPFAREIQHWTHSPYSHAAIFVWLMTEQGNRELWLFESLEPHGVRARPFLRYLEEDTADGVIYEWWPLDASDSIRESMAAYLRGRVGDGYVRPSQFLWSFVCRPGLRRWLCRTFGLPVNLRRQQVFCSELCVLAWARACFQNQRNPHLPKDPALFSPADLPGLGAWRDGVRIVP